MLDRLSQRNELQAIVDEKLTGTRENAFKQLKEQASRIESILKRPSITHPTHLDPQDFQEMGNCHAFSLGLWKSYEILKILSQKLQYSQRNLIDSSFIKILLGNQALKEITVPHVNDLLLYFDDKKAIKHSGLIKDITNDLLLVESKWGVLPVFEHELWQVPTSYGSNIKYFNLPELKLILDLISKIV